MRIDARARGIHQDTIGPHAFDPRDKAASGRDDLDVVIDGLAQALLEHRRAQAAIVYDHDSQLAGP